MSVPGSGSPTPTTATSGLEDPRQGADTNEAAEARTDELRAEREYLAAMIAHPMMANPVWMDADVCDRCTKALEAADRILAAGFRRVPEDAETVERVGLAMVRTSFPRAEWPKLGSAGQDFWRELAGAAIAELRGGSVSGGGDNQEGDRP